MKTVPKHIHLAWRILHNSLPVRKNFIHRGVDCIPLCPRCVEMHEDIDHIFRFCSWAKRIWFSSNLGINFDQVEVNFRSWLAKIINYVMVYGGLGTKHVLKARILIQRRQLCRLGGEYMSSKVQLTPKPFLRS